MSGWEVRHPVMPPGGHLEWQMAVHRDPGEAVKVAKACGARGGCTPDCRRARAVGYRVYVVPSPVKSTQVPEDGEGPG